MIAATFTIPTLAWVLPLMAVVLAVWVWAWNRWVTPILIARIERIYRRRMAEAGATPERIDAGWAEITEQRNGR